MQRVAQCSLFPSPRAADENHKLPPPATRLLALSSQIANTVQEDPHTYSEAFLGKSPSEYAAWISSDRNWGGAIEIAILSKFFARQIVAVDVQTGRADWYGQDRGDREGVLLLYDGIHYDAIALTPAHGAPQDCDVTGEAAGARGTCAYYVAWVVSGKVLRDCHGIADQHWRSR